MRKISSNLYLVIGAAVLVLSLINLINAVYFLLQSSDRRAAANVMIIVPIAMIVVVGGIIYKLRNDFGESTKGDSKKR